MDGRGGGGRIFTFYYRLKFGGREGVWIGIEKNITKTDILLPEVVQHKLCLRWKIVCRIITTWRAHGTVDSFLMYTEIEGRLLTVENFVGKIKIIIGDDNVLIYVKSTMNRKRSDAEFSNTSAK